MVSQRKGTEKTFCDLTSTESKNGHSINVNKYCKDSGNFTIHDVSRAENTVELLSTFVGKLQSQKENILALRSQLFNANSILRKVWKANEMKFYDTEIETHENMIKVMSDKHDRVAATARQLKERFFSRDVGEADERRSKRRKSENKKKPQ